MWAAILELAVKCHDSSTAVCNVGVAVLAAAQQHSRLASSTAVAAGVQAVVAGHLDGSIYKFTFPSEDGTIMGHQRIVQHTCIPYALAWGQAIAAGGNDSKVREHAEVSARQLARGSIATYHQRMNGREPAKCRLGA